MVLLEQHEMVRDALRSFVQERRAPNAGSARPPYLHQCSQNIICRHGGLHYRVGASSMKKGYKTLIDEAMAQVMTCKENKPKH